MDDFKPNRSVDGMSSGAVPSRTPEPGSAYANDQDLTDLGPTPNSTAPSFESHPNHVPITGNGGGSGKKAKVFAIIFGVLFLAALAFAFYQYTQVQDTKKQLDTANAEIQKLKAENYSLSYDSKDSTKKYELLSTKTSALESYAKQLKDACGKSCTSITLQVKTTP